MKRGLAAEAMALAVELTFNELRAASAVPPADAWLQEGLEAIAWERPSAADPEGFVTVGELRDLRTERTGSVLVNPATKALRITWSNDFGN